MESISYCCYLDTLFDYIIFIKLTVCTYVTEQFEEKKPTYKEHYNIKVAPSLSLPPSLSRSLF